MHPQEDRSPRHSSHSTVTTTAARNHFKRNALSNRQTNRHCSLHNSESIQLCPERGVDVSLAVVGGGDRLEPVRVHFRAAKAGRGRRRLGPDGLDQITTGDHGGRVAGATQAPVRCASMGEERGRGRLGDRSDQTAALRPLRRCQPINPSPAKPTIIIAQVEGSGIADPTEPPTFGLKTME